MRHARSILVVAAMLTATGRTAAAQARPGPHVAQPERPTVATHAFTVAPGWLEIETGWERDATGDGSLGIGTPTTLKVGLSDRLQLGLAGSVQHTGGGGAVAATGVGDAGVALKVRLTDELPTLGALAVQPSVRVPTGSAARGLGGGTTDVGITLISSHRWGEYALDVNVGAGHRTGGEPGAPRDTLFWTTSVALPVAGPLSWQVELFGAPGTSGDQGRPPLVGFLSAIAGQVRPWLVLDAGVVVPVHGPQPRVLFAGATWNIGCVLSGERCAR